MTTAYINRIATSVPPHDVHRSFVAFAEEMMPEGTQRSLFRRMVRMSAIEHRYSFLQPIASENGVWRDAEDLYATGNFPDTARRAVYARKCVYDNVCGWQSFEPWLSRIESFDPVVLWAIAADVPPDWVEPERLSQLIECIDARRGCVRELIAVVRQSPHNPFRAWIEEQP